MKIVSVLLLLAAAVSATNVDVPCETGASLNVGYATAAGPRSVSIDLTELKTHSLEGVNATYTVKCPVGSVHKPMRNEGQVKSKQECSDCVINIIKSGAPKGLPIIAAVVKKGTVAKMKTPSGATTTSNAVIYARSAKITANLRANQKLMGYFEHALGTISHSAVAGTPMQGEFHSGLDDVAENRWRPQAAGSVSLDAQSEDYTTAFVVQMSADFGASPTGLALNVRDADGVEVLPAAVRSGGAEGKVAFTSPPRLVHKICPFVVKTKKLDVVLTAPSTSPKSILDKMIYSKLGSVNADSAYPEGMRFSYQIVNFDDEIVGHGLTVDDVNKMPSSLSADKKARATAMLSAFSSADASEPCLDVMSGANPVKRNWPNTFDANCQDKESELAADAFFASCATCAGCKTLGTASSTAQAKKDVYAAKCPMWGLGLVDEAGLKAQAGWASDKASLAHANQYCQLNDDYKAEADTVTAAPSGYMVMSATQCKNFADAYTSVPGFNPTTPASITWGATETVATWPKGCYIMQNGKVYFNYDNDGAAKTNAQRVHMSHGLAYGATYRMFVGATCHKCYISPGSRRSAAPIEMAVVDTANKRLTVDAPNAVALDAYERGDVSRAKEHADALAANAAYAASDKKASSRRLLSTGFYTPPTAANGGACKSDGNFALESTCGGGCAFALNSGWCEANTAAPWKGKAGCYSRGAHGGCKQEFCRIGTTETKTVNDATLSEDYQMQTYCQDACKGFTGLPFKWTNQAGWLSPAGQSVTEAQHRAACSANGASCNFLKLGRCFDDFSTYFSARATAGLATVGLTKLRTAADVELARQKGIVCPNELAHECGLYDIKGTFDLPESANATAWVEQRTCESLPLIDPNSAASIDKMLSPFTHDADVQTRYAQVQKLGCLAFAQCDWNPAKGCHTKVGHSGTCLEETMADMHCDEFTDANKFASCKSSAQRVCDNLRDEESIIRQILPLKNKLNGHRMLKGLGIKARDFLQTMMQIRLSIMSDAPTEEALLSTKLNLGAQATQYAVCKAKIGNYYNNEAAITPSTLLDYHTKRADTNACMDKLLHYAEAKLVQKFDAASGTAGPTITHLVENTVPEFVKTGRTVVQQAARFDICTSQMDTGFNRVNRTIASFGDSDSDVSDLPMCLQNGYKAYVDLKTMLLRLMNPSAAAEQNNEIVLVAGDVTFEPNFEASFCSQLGAAPAGFSHSISGCPSGGAQSQLSSFTYNMASHSKARAAAERDSGSRRSGNAANAACPPGSTANGTHTGPRCWNAYTNSQLYFPDSYTMKTNDCASAPTDNSNNDGVGASGMNVCLNGMQDTECTTSTQGNDRLIYWRDPDDDNTWLSSSARCVLNEAATIENAANPAATESSQLLQGLNSLAAAVQTHHGETACITGGDSTSKDAVKNMYKSLGFCSRI